MCVALPGRRLHLVLRLAKDQLHLIPIMHQPLLDLLQPVCFLPDMDQLPEDNRTTPERADRVFAAGRTVWTQALGFRMGPVAGDDITVGLHAGRAFIEPLAPGGGGERLPGIDIRPAQL